MMRVKNTARLLLLTSLLLTAVWCEKESLYVYSVAGGEAYLPCTNLMTSDCSRISWTFFFKGDGVRYTTEISMGKVGANADKAGRMSLLSNCSLVLRDLRPEDAGSYVCLLDRNATTDVYFSVLSITSGSSITDLQPGGSLSLSCVLFTYFDAGSCKWYSNVFDLSWTAEDGTKLPQDSRYKLISPNRCNVTLLISNLQSRDNNRRLRCQVNTTQSPQDLFLDFKSTFLFGDSSSVQRVIPSESNCDWSEQLPISRIVLCVALPIMVIIVGFFTWRVDQKMAKNRPDIELHEFK
ncbi:sialoadhesin-like [Cheilinus undulatus]|uniref:sialoadhesin-like n=1 Tax=Cheilinus undulatus TaxID=241271 RepID=UPI001BD200E2|nr:sialoadhesin-like [Cheilinus undulatus]